jgi:hypothetical protein
VTVVEAKILGPIHSFANPNYRKTIFYIPLFLQAVFLERPFQSAVSILPLAASVVFFTVCGAVIVEIIRQYKWAIVISWIMSVVGIALWLLWRQDSSAGLIGLAIASTIFNNVFESHMHRIGDLPIELSSVKDAKEAIANIPVLASPQLDADVVNKVVEVYRTAFRGSFYFLIGSAAIDFGFSFCMVDLTLEKQEIGRQALQVQEKGRDNDDQGSP